MTKTQEKDRMVKVINKVVNSGKKWYLISIFDSTKAKKL